MNLQLQTAWPIAPPTVIPGRFIDSSSDRLRLFLSTRCEQSSGVSPSIEILRFSLGLLFTKCQAVDWYAKVNFETETAPQFQQRTGHPALVPTIVALQPQTKLECHRIKHSGEAATQPPE